MARPAAFGIEPGRSDRGSGGNIRANGSSLSSTLHRYALFFVPSVILDRYRPFTLNRPQTPCAFVRFGAALLTVLSDRERC